LLKFFVKYSKLDVCQVFEDILRIWPRVYTLHGIHEIDIYGQTWKIAPEEIDRGAALEGEARFSVYERHDLHERRSACLNNGLCLMARQTGFRLPPEL